MPCNQPSPIASRRATCILRQPVIGIVNRDMVAIDKIGRKDHQIGAAGVTQRRKQDAPKPGGENQIRKLPAPGTIPLLPSAVPDARVESLRKVGDLGECDLVGG